MNVEAIIRGFMKRAADLPLNPRHPFLNTKTPDVPPASDQHFDLVSSYNQIMDKKLEPIINKHLDMDTYKFFKLPEVSKIVNEISNNKPTELSPFVYHGANSNMNSSMILEGDLRYNKRPLLLDFLNKNPSNSFLVNMHGGGEPNYYSVGIDKSSIGKNDFPTPNVHFNVDDLKKTIGDKATNVHNLYLSTCNQRGGGAPTEEFTKAFPNMTNMVASPQGRFGVVNDLLSIGAGKSRPFGMSMINPMGIGTRPVQYLKGTNGNWSTNTFKGYNK